MERKQVLEALYSTISDKSKVLINTGVASYTEQDDKVTVVVEDGTTYEGDIFIGADGIHSTVRKLMGHAIARDQKQTIDEKSDPLGKLPSLRLAILNSWLSAFNRGASL